MAMNKRVKQKWLRALKSGEYAKGKGRLGRTRYTDTEFCCLGVLVCEMTPEFFQRGQYDWWQVDDFGNYLPDDLAAHWGLDDNTQQTLAKLNDDSVSFDPVIAYIENNL